MAIENTIIFWVSMYIEFFSIKVWLYDASYKVPPYLWKPIDCLKCVFSIDCQILFRSKSYELLIASSMVRLYSNALRKSFLCNSLECSRIYCKTST